MNYLTRENPIYDYNDIKGFIAETIGCGCGDCVKIYLSGTDYSIDDLCYMDDTELNEVIK